MLREHHYTYCIPVISGRNVWVGANVSILPGSDHRRQLRDWRRFGRDTFHPRNSVTYGAPCEVVREIGDKDREYFYKNRKLDVWE